MESNLFLRKTEKTAVFIDGANLYHTSKGAGVEIDFKKVHDLFRDNCQLTRLFYYTAVSDGEEHDPLRRTLDWMQFNGFTMVTKPLKRWERGGVEYRKGNMDIELALDMLRMSEYIEHAVLISGDGDFRIVVEEVQRRGVRVSVISEPRSSAEELRRQADDFITISSLKDEIGRAEDHQNA